MILRKILPDLIASEDATVFFDTLNANNASSSDVLTAIDAIAVEGRLDLFLSVAAVLVKRGAPSTAAAAAISAINAGHDCFVEVCEGLRRGSSAHLSILAAAVSSSPPAAIRYMIAQDMDPDIRLSVASLLVDAGKTSAAIQICFPDEGESIDMESVCAFAMDLFSKDPSAADLFLSAVPCDDFQGLISETIPTKMVSSMPSVQSRLDQVELLRIARQSASEKTISARMI